MNKYKICVYAICKNEAKFVDRWVNSMSEADEIYVLDTGSTDNTADLLKERGVNVTIEKINPWRFDEARNKSLELVPPDCDICVCTDLDEIFEKGWRNKLECLWNLDTTRLAYHYNWNFDENNNPLINFYIEKIHSRNDYKWIHPVHEVLTYIGQGKESKIITDEIIVNHYPDNTKSRSSYLPLLELSVQEDPTDDRNTHYLGREYMYYGKWNESIDTLIKHLSLPTATWRDERCASMRFISRCYIQLKRFDEAKMWIKKAMKEAPHLRDSFVEAALLEYQLNNWKLVKKYCVKALTIEKHPKTYINEPFSFDGTIEDLLSLCYYNEGNYKKALNTINIAIQLKPNNKRLLANRKIIKQKMNNN